MLHSISRTDIERTILDWANAVQRRDLDATVALYEPDEGQLLGTLDTRDTRLRHSRARIRDYFTSFLANDEIIPCFPADVSDHQFVTLGADHAAYSGYYDFILRKGSHHRVAHAKFTFIVRRLGERLAIVTHNSGLTPEGIE